MNMCDCFVCKYLYLCLYRQTPGGQFCGRKVWLHSSYMHSARILMLEFDILVKEFELQNPQEKFMITWTKDSSVLHMLVIPLNAYKLYKCTYRRISP